MYHIFLFFHHLNHMIFEMNHLNMILLLFHLKILVVNICMIHFSIPILLIDYYTYFQMKANFHFCLLIMMLFLIHLFLNLLYLKMNLRNILKKNHLDNIILLYFLLDFHYMNLYHIRLLFNFRLNCCFFSKIYLPHNILFS